MGALRRAAPVPSARPFVKRPLPQVVETAACGPVAREKPARRAAGAGEEFFPVVPNPKRAKVACNGVERSVDHALGTLRKRMAAELDAVHALLRKAELLSGGKNGRSMAAAKQRSEAPVEEVSVKPPAAKRRKASAPLAEIAKLESRVLLPEDKDEFVDICGGVSPVAIQSVSPLVAAEKASESGDSESSRDLPEDESEFIDICGGVSPVAIRSVSPLVAAEKASESGDSETKDFPEEESEFVDICGGVSPIVSIEKEAVNSGNSSSSSSDSRSSSSSSDSDSDNESDTVNIPAPPAVLPKKNSRSVQPPPEPASEVGQSTEPEKISNAALIAKGNLRRTLLEMERAALPDESILPRDLKDLCIVEYGRASIMQRLGLFLKADA